MRVYCQCGEPATVTKSEKISDLTRGFYIACIACGRKYHGTVHLDRETRPARDDMNMKLLNVLAKLSTDQQQQIIKQYT